MLGTIAVWLLLGLAAADVPGVAADENRDVEREIKALELHLADLLVRRDLDTYSTFLSRDYTRINDHGEVQTREQVLAQFRASPGGGTMEPTELVVQSYGDTAILTGILKVKPGDPSRPERTSRFRKVFVRRDGRWYLVSLQGAPYAPTGEERPSAAGPPGFDPTEIRAAERALVTALESPDPTAWVYLYTEDAVFLEAGGPPVAGRPALLEMAKAMKPLSSVTFSAERTVGAGTLAYVYGTASWVNGRPPDAGSTSRVRGVIIWQKQADGRWRVAQEVLAPEPAASSR